MGRTLETLKFGEARRPTIALSKPADETPVQDCVTDWEIAEEVPFVEVGAPNKKVELSPSLMKHPPQPAAQPPHLMTEPVVPAAKAVSLTPAKPMTVAFEPLPTATALGVGADIVTYHQPELTTSLEYAGLLQTLQSGLKAGRANVLMLTGIKANVGASTVLLNLAVRAALAQKLRVMLIDANGTQPGLAQRLGQTASTSFKDVVQGSVALEHAIAKTGIGNLHVLPTGDTPLASQALTWLVAWLRERYDLILIDGPTVDDTAGLSLHVAHADGVYLVLPRDTKPEGHAGVAQSLRSMGARLSGLIHTHFDV
jgi:Mrp family chromosome partitioning ATPase